MTHYSHDTILQWPDPVLGTIEIPIGQLEETEVNPDHVLYEEARE